jgi:hypothetical protein
VTNDEIHDLPSNTLVLCADGCMGQLILTLSDGRVGVLVPGEEDIRWIDMSRLEKRGAPAVAESGAPAEPPACKLPCADQTSAVARMTYSDLWKSELSPRS